LLKVSFTFFDSSVIDEVYEVSLVDSYPIYFALRSFCLAAKRTKKIKANPKAPPVWANPRTAPLQSFDPSLQ
jgi:hypothetical protein